VSMCVAVEVLSGVLGKRSVGPLGSGFNSSPVTSCQSATAEIKVDTHTHDLDQS
jgi:hypothetical protein